MTDRFSRDALLADAHSESYSNFLINERMKNKLHRKFHEEKKMFFSVPAVMALAQLTQLNKAHTSGFKMFQVMTVCTSLASYIWIDHRKDKLLKQFDYIDVNYPLPSKAQYELKNNSLERDFRNENNLFEISSQLNDYNVFSAAEMIEINQMTENIMSNPAIDKNDYKRLIKEFENDLIKKRIDHNESQGVLEEVVVENTKRTDGIQFQSKLYEDETGDANDHDHGHNGPRGHLFASGLKSLGEINIGI